MFLYIKLNIAKRRIMLKKHLTSIENRRNYVYARIIQLENLHFDNFYSGSFNYDVSFLDKDHTLIMNIDKPAELFDGIGQKGLVIVPRYIHPKIKNNINYYLQQAGIIDSSPNSQIQLSNDVN